VTERNSAPVDFFYSRLLTKRQEKKGRERGWESEKVKWDRRKEKERHECIVNSLGVCCP
jgi:hypothetical protein